MSRRYSLQEDSDLDALGRDAGSPSAHSAAGKRALTQSLSPRPVIFRVANADAAHALGAALGGKDASGVAPDAHHALDRAAADGGAPLRADLRDRFEASLGTDLSAVRVHTGGASAEASAAVGARAYAVGNDIHFGTGEYQPDDPFGLHLLAHEVAHTAQQGGSAPQRQHKLAVSSPDDAAEIEADHAADAMVAGEPATLSSNRSGVQRKKWGEDGEPEQRTAASGAAVDPAAPADDQLEPVIDVIVLNYQALLDKQEIGLDILRADLEKKDEPSLAETLIMTAVETALGAAAGRIGTAIGTLAGSLAQKGVAAAVNAGSPKPTAGEQHWIDAGLAEGPKKPSVPQIAKQVADFISEKIKGKVTSKGKELVTGRPKGGSIARFILAQKEALIDAKLTAQQAIISKMSDFKVRDGLKGAEAIRDAVEQRYEEGKSTQYLESVKEWWRAVGTGKLGDRDLGIRVTATASEPSAELTLTTADAPGLNDAVKGTLQSEAGIHDRTVARAGMDLIITVVTKAHDNLPPYTFEIRGPAGGKVREWPRSGDGMVWLFYRQEGRRPTSTDEQSMVAQIQSQLILNKVSEQTLGTLPDMTD